MLNDGAVVEHFGDVVAGGADQLYTAFERLMVGAGTHERGQERMMDIDDPLRIAVHEIVRKNLHVAGQNYEVRFVLSDQGLDSFLGLLLVVFDTNTEEITQWIPAL